LRGGPLFCAIAKPGAAAIGRVRQGNESTKMRLFLLTAVVMVAFAANSLLNRAGLLQPGMDAISFGTLRLVAGAGVLGVLFWLRQRRRPQGTRSVIAVRGVLPLLLYIYGFSAAYGALDAGLGALVLFGCVQLTMFIAAISQGEVLSMRRLLGAAVAFGGLVLLLAPMGAGAAISLPHAAAMAAAGIGWGVYSLLGRGAPDPLAATATNFAGAAVLGMGASLGLALWQGLPMPPPAGVALAVLSGAVTSGLGYAVWYQILPQLRASTAAIAQLTVPVIAVLAGVLLLGEALSAQALLATAVVLSGVLLSLSGARRS